MKNKICQSCGMPLPEEDLLGFEKDGSKSPDYCKYCYQNGEFIDKVSMEEYIDLCSEYSDQANMSKEEMKEHCSHLFPTLKRWKCTCTEECASGYNPNCTCQNKDCHCREKSPNS